VASKPIGAGTEGPGRPAPDTTKWSIWVKKSTKEALESAHGSGYGGASKTAARLLDNIVEALKK